MSIPNELVQEIKGILQKTIASLKNLEGHLNTRTEDIKTFNKNVDKLEKKMNKDIKKINDSFPKMENKVIGRINKMSEKTEKLTVLLKGYKDAFQSLSDEAQPTISYDINTLLYDVVNLEEIDFSQPIVVSRPVAAGKGGKVSTSGVAAKAAKIQSQLAGTSQASTSEESSGDTIIDPNKWTDSEIEGFGVFDELITGWKLRDFEKLKGTREIFAIGWRKLSSHDRKRIRNGAWSDPIIKKLTMLGRSRFEDD